MPTKAELEAENRLLKSQIEELMEQLNARDAVLSKSGEEGWLITTPNSRYAGVVAGIEFRGGRAFIGDSHPDAASLALMFKSDFGYRITRMTAKDFDNLAPGPEKQPASANEALVVDGVFGG